VLHAFINPSGPTREPREVSVSVSAPSSYSTAKHTMETPAFLGDRRHMPISIGALRIQALDREAFA